MGLGSFVNINIFVMKYYFTQFSYILHFFKSFKSKSTQMLRPQKGNSGVLPNDTLLNVGLCVHGTPCTVIHNAQYTVYVH